jgi:predicted nucleotidyltransferase
MATTDKLTELDDSALAGLVRRLVEIYHPLRLYLFGSRARGDWGPDSDYDLLIVLPGGEQGTEEQQRRAFSAEWETEVWSDVIVMSDDEFHFRLGARASLPSTAVREGRVLYAA